MQTRIVTQDHLEKLEKKMRKFVKTEEFMDLVKDVRDCTTKHEFSVLDETFKNMKKEYNCFMKLEDFAIKMRVIMDELETKL